MHLPDRPRVVLTGANRGIGFHMLSALVEYGYRVAGLDVDGANLASLEEARPESVRYVPCDVTDTEMTRGLGSPAWLLNDPAEVGAKLAGKIESTDPVVTADWQTSVGLACIRLFPSLWGWATGRFVDLRR